VYCSMDGGEGSRSSDSQTPRRCWRAVNHAVSRAPEEPRVWARREQQLGGAVMRLRLFACLVIVAIAVRRVFEMLPPQEGELPNLK